MNLTLKEDIGIFSWVREIVRTHKETITDQAAPCRHTILSNNILTLRLLNLFKLMKSYKR